MKEIIAVADAPRAIGPYSQAVKFSGQVVYVSGQVPLDPASGQLVGPGIEAQTHRVLQNLRSVLSGAGCGLQDVVKTTIYLTDMANFKLVNAIYAEYFPDAPPARATIQVSGLPLGADVEIEAVAAIP
jgi:2-iminobutanoate/2-iminopropanoate deaminase